MKVSDVVPNRHYIAHLNRGNSNVTAAILKGGMEDRAALVLVTDRGPFLEKVAGICGEKAVIEAPGVELAFRCLALVDGEWIDRALPSRAFIIAWEPWLEMRTALVDAATTKQLERDAYSAREKALQDGIDEICKVRFGWRYVAGGDRERATVDVDLDVLLPFLRTSSKVERTRLVRLIEDLRDLKPPACAR